MIANWMLYSAVISILLTVAAIGAERATAICDVPQRAVWLAAVLASLVWPLANLASRVAPNSAHALKLAPFTIAVVTPAMVVHAWGARTDAVLLALWSLVSLVLTVRLVVGARALRRARRGWRDRNVDGTPVRLSDHVGPAVVGLRPMDVVLPEWILSLDAPLRAIVLRHEEEHRLARDPYLLFISAIATALMPWNAALWYQSRRLRLAVEIDCDSRVLHAYPMTERYGLLMLTIAQRRMVAPTQFAPMLSEPGSQLERRIRAMTTAKRVGRRTAYASATLTAATLALACSLHSDAPTSPNASVRTPASPVRIASGTYLEFQVEKPVTPVPGQTGPRYPDALRTAHVEGEVLAQFVVDQSGAPMMSTFKVLKSSNGLFTDVVKAQLSHMKFNPAEVGGRTVRQLVEMPFQFTLSRS